MTLLPAFIKKFFNNKIPTQFDWQCWYRGKYKNKDTKEKLVGYDTQYRKLTQSDLIKHFYEDIREPEPNKLLSSLSLSGLSEGFVNVVSIDIDDLEQMNAWQSKLQPLLDKNDIEYFIEWGGNETNRGFDRCHVLLFLSNLQFDTAKNLIRSLFWLIEEPLFANEIKHFDRYERARPLFDEVFPINKPNQKIRPPFGFHQRRDRRYPCQYKDQILESPVAVLKAIKECKAIILERANELINQEICDLLDSQKLNVLPSKRNSYDKFYYYPINLPTPASGLPARILPMVKNCKTIHHLISEAVRDDWQEEGKLQKPREGQHDAGVDLYAMLAWHDKTFKNDLGRQFFGHLIENFRTRSAEDHHWGYYGLDKAYVLRCDSWDEKYGMCDGCPYQNLVGNPINLIPIRERKANGKLKIVNNIPITKNLVAKMKLTTYDEIRTNEFPLIEDYIVNLVLK